MLQVHRWRDHRVLAARGFTLLEVVVAISIAALLVTATVPAATTMYQSMQYRSAVREVRTTLESARLRALSTGQLVNVLIHPRKRELRLGRELVYTLSDRLSLSVVSARELQQAGQAVIRFYPDGTSTGGSIDIIRPSGAGSSLEVGWLLGEVKQHAVTP